MTTLDRGPRRGRGRALLALVATGACALVAACGSTSATAEAPPTPTLIRPPDPRQDAVPPAPQGRPLLAITGRIGATNSGRELHLDQAALDRMGLRAMSVNDPWAKKRIDLQGCWLRDVIALARPDPAATTLHLHALDDYQVDLKLADVSADEIFLATRDGKGGALPVEDGGPTRVVFSDDLAMRFSADLWIWNIDTIDVR